MAYTDDIPKPTDLISNSQGQLRANFNAIDSSVFGFARNHVALTDSTNGGLHTRVDYYLAVTDPAISGFVASLYTKAAANPVTNELFYRNAGTINQITGPFLKSVNNGYIFLPGGILVKWGWLIASSGANTVTYSTGASVPVFSEVYQVFMQSTAGSSSSNWFAHVTDTPGSFAIDKFNFYSTQRTAQSAATGTYSWLAIGAA